MPTIDHDLEPEEAERLSILLEEMGESLQIIGKIQRHGYDNYHPKAPDITNRMLLEKELGHVTVALDLMCRASDIREDKVVDHAKEKLKTLREWVHYDHEGL